MKTVYLAGGIYGLTSDQCNNWRNQVTEALKDKFKFLNPMRRDYRGKEQDDAVAREIVIKDLADIEESDIMLMMAQVPSWGTAMECVYANQMDKFIIVVVKDRKTMSPWLRHHGSAFVETVEEAIEMLRGMA